MNDSFETSSIGTPLDSQANSRQNSEKQSDSDNSSAEQSDNESVMQMGRSNKIDMKEISPPQSPMSIQEEEESTGKNEPKKGRQVKKRKHVLEDDVVRMKVDELLAKIDGAVKEDRDLILRKKPGWIIRSTEASPYSRTRETSEESADC